MYKDTEIRLTIYEEYFKLVRLLKRKGASSSKLNELEAMLDYFIKNYDDFNDEEKKLIKNVIIIATSMINNTNTCYGFIRERRDSCLTLTKKLKEKQKNL